MAVANDGQLTKVTEIKDSDNPAFILRGAWDVATAVVNNVNYLFVAANEDNGVSVFAILPNGMLQYVDSVIDGGPGPDDPLELYTARSLTTAKVGTTTYLFVAGFFDSGVSVFAIGNDGKLRYVDTIRDDDTLALDGIERITTAPIKGKTYLFVVGGLDDGVSVFEIENGGKLKNVDNVRDSDNPAFVLDATSGVTTAEIAGTTYLFVTAINDNGVSVFRVNY